MMRKPRMWLGAYLYFILLAIAASPDPTLSSHLPFPATPSPYYLLHDFSSPFVSRLSSCIKSPASTLAPPLELFRGLIFLSFQS